MTDIFEELAHKTVSELFDLLKEQIEENKGLKAENGRLTSNVSVFRDEKTHAINRWSAVCKERDEYKAQLDQLSKLATELAEYASYAEIIGAVLHNKAVIRKCCDDIFELNRSAEEADINFLVGHVVKPYLSGLSIAKMREIVNGAPEWAKYWITRDEYHGDVLSFPNMTGQSSFLIDDLRKAIADHDAKNMVKFSLNNYVRFKPTPYGLEHYTAKMREFTSHMRSIKVDTALKLDPEGYAKLQMHEFMNIFGEIAFNGNDNFIVGCEITFCLSGA